MTPGPAGKWRPKVRVKSQGERLNCSGLRAAGPVAVGQGNLCAGGGVDVDPGLPFAAGLDGGIGEVEVPAVVDGLDGVAGAASLPGRIWRRFWGRRG